MTHTLIEEAADWFARKRSGKMTADELQELHAWLSRSPDHAEVMSERESLGVVNRAATASSR